MHDKKTIAAFLSQHPLFENLSNRQYMQLEKHTQIKSYRKNEIIFREQQPADHFYLILNGQVKVSKISTRGKEYILHIMKAGDILAEAPMFEGGQYPAHATALITTKLLAFPRQNFIELVQKDPQIAMNMLALQAKRLREFTYQLEEITLKESAARLAHYLLTQANPSFHHITLAISRAALANVLGIGRENLSRILSQWSKQKIIVQKGKTITLLDSTKLKKIALN